MLLVPCNRKSGCDDLGCLGPWDGFAPIPRIIKWKGLRLTWNKGGGKSQEIWFFPNYAVMLPLLCIPPAYGLAF